MAQVRKDAYPRPPWRLRGQGAAAVWLVRKAVLPRAPIPPGWSLFTFGPWAFVGAVLADYGEGGDLACSELAVGLVVRRGAALAITLPWVWVDSQASGAGGRALWAIPKQPASFHREGRLTTVETADGAASISVGEPGLRFGRQKLGFAVAQPTGDSTRLAGALVTAELRRASAAWKLPAPLQAIPERPLACVRLEGLELVFGD